MSQRIRITLHHSIQTAPFHQPCYGTSGVEKFPEGKSHRTATRRLFYDLTAACAHPEDLQISKCACGIIEVIPFEYQSVSAEQARQLFKDQPYKIELIDGLSKRNDEDGNHHPKTGNNHIQTQVQRYVDLM